MRNATLVLLAAAIVCCPIVSQEASANDRYTLTGPGVAYEGIGVLDGMTMTPAASGRPTTVMVGGQQFSVDSFFDVFTELAPPSMDFQVDSFFDITYQIDLGGGQFHVDSFFDVFVEVDVMPELGTNTFAVSIHPQTFTLSNNGLLGVLPSTGTTRVTQLGNGQFSVDSFFDVFTELSVDGGSSYVPGAGPVAVRFFPKGVPAPREVPGKEYSHHADINAPATLDPMQNLAWDGTGSARDTFDYDDAINHDWPQGTNVDAIANIQDRFFQDVVNDRVPLLVTLDDGAAAGTPVPGDYENIHYQTPGPASVTGIWAKGVIPGVPPTSEIHAVAVQNRAGADPNHQFRWLSPTGIEVWGPEVKKVDEGVPGIGDDAVMFSTNADWQPIPGAGGMMPAPAVWKYDPVAKTVTPYIMADQIRDAIGLQEDQLVDVDGMMIFDMEKDDQFGPGDSIMFTVHTLKDASGGTVLDGGEIWVWKFDDGPMASATFLNHGGVTWDTANSVAGIFPNVFAEENIGGLEAVPEPSSIALLFVAAISLLGLQWRRRS